MSQNLCRLGDIAQTIEPHEHGTCPSCPHTCQGPAVSASANVMIGGAPALRQSDIGIHETSLCCGPNQWAIIQASGNVYINGSPAVRVGDKTLHCGVSTGKMITGAGGVFDGSPAVAIPLGMPLRHLNIPDPTALPCNHPLYVDPNRKERPHAESGDPEAWENARRERARLAELLGYPVDHEREVANAEAALRAANKAVQETANGTSRALKEAQERRNRAEASHREAQARRAAAGARGRSAPRR
jgi:uncharacterized Zn-binding protein involved in type VI secretion